MDQLQGARPRGRYDPGLALVQCAFLLLLAPHLGFVPLWDSSEYVDHCLLPAIRDLNPDHVCVLPLGPLTVVSVG